MVIILEHYSNKTEHNNVFESVRNTLVNSDTKHEAINILSELSGELGLVITMFDNEDGFQVRVAQPNGNDFIVFTSFERNLDGAKVFWDMLGNVPTNEKAELDEDFFFFTIGTDNEDVWYWVEEEFNVSVAKDLMGLV